MSLAEEFQAALGAAGQTYEHQMARTGLTLATVTNINDDQKLNRVKCLPIENEKSEETDWCYVMAPLGGNACGQFFFPRVGDLVVLGYLGGDPHRPMVLGAWWDNKIKPPYTVQNGKIYEYCIKTPGGSELLFYDEPKKQRVTLTLPSGTVLSIDDEKQSVQLGDSKGENALTLELKSGNVTLKAEKKLTLSAGNASNASIIMDSSGNLKIDAQGRINMQGVNIEQKARGKFGIQANGALSLQSSGVTQVKGAVVNIN